MKSYIGITGKYLRTQKRRSILTAVGIVLSVALVTGIGNIFLSMYDANVRGTIQNYGDYYAAFPQVPGGKAALIAQNVDVEKAGFEEDVGFAAYSPNDKNGIDTPYKYLDIKALDANATAMLPGYTLEDGRLPQAPGEIAVDDWTLKYLSGGAAIGSTVTLDIGTRTLPDGTVSANAGDSSSGETFTKTATARYTIVGTLKPRYVLTLNFANAVTFLDAGSLPADSRYTAYVKLKSPSDAQNRLKAVADAAGLEIAKGQANEIQYNDHLLRLYAQSINATFNTNFLSIMCVVVLLVVLSTIAVIYNAFNISVVERVSQFGLLRCVGATPRQIANIVFREALILGAIGIPAGILCGMLAMGVVFAVISSIAPEMLIGGLRLVVSPWLMLISALVGAFTIYLSALLPARKAAKISPMEAVRGSHALRKEKYRRTKKHRLALRVLGAEGWMAWKNLGRNRRRFYITVLSMVISIVLYIVFSSLVSYAYHSGAVSMGSMPSYVVSPKNGADRLDESGLADIAQLQGVDYALSYSEAYGEAAVPADKVTPRAKELINQAGAQGAVTLNNCSVACFQDGGLDAVTRALGLSNFDAEAFLQGSGMILVNGGEMLDVKGRKDVLLDMTTLAAGDSVDLTVTSGYGDNPANIHKKVGILAVAREGLPGYGRNQSGGVNLLVSEKLFRELAPSANFPTNLMVVMKQGADHKAVKARLDAFMDAHPNFNLLDMDDAASNFKQASAVMGIFLYGFVAVISLIGCLNIINTISTNIILRTRELSVMRAVGMTDGGIRSMVALESVLHGAVAALVGVLAGAALSWIVYNLLVQVREFPWSFPWQQALVAVGAAALVAVVSGFVPLRRINKGVIMEGIRGEE